MNNHPKPQTKPRKTPLKSRKIQTQAVAGHALSGSNAREGLAGRPVERRSVGLVAPKSPEFDVPVLGVDPGGRDTGIILVDGSRVAGCSVRSPGELLPVDQGYIQAVLAEVGELIASTSGDVVVCVEGVTRPSWHVQASASYGAAANPTGLIAAAVVLGAVLGAYPGAVVVPPGGNGSRPLGAYPAGLVSDGERRKSGWELRVGGGKLRHQRSAWDVAFKGHDLHVSQRVAKH
ncbi:RuvC-like resolvase [Corynebacterium phage PSonyx]|nr:RuvC-like resolvase [Corynebacterium phage PSonyx]